MIKDSLPIQDEWCAQMASKKRQALLLRDYHGLGEVADLVDVSPGFFRNYLQPKKIATYPNLIQFPDFARARDRLIEKRSREKEMAEEFAQQLQDDCLYFVRQHNQSGLLYGSVRSRDILRELKQRNCPVDIAILKPPDPMKFRGIYKILIIPYKDVVFNIFVSIANSGEGARIQYENRKEEIWISEMASAVDKNIRNIFQEEIQPIKEAISVDGNIEPIGQKIQRIEERQELMWTLMKIMASRQNIDLSELGIQ